MLAASLTTLMLALAPQGDEAAAPQGLTIVVADVGQGGGVDLGVGVVLGDAGQVRHEFAHEPRRINVFVNTWYKSDAGMIILKKLRDNKELEGIIAAL